MKYFMSFLSVLVICLGGAQAQTQNSDLPDKVAAGPAVVLGVGDSLFSGYGIPSKMNVPKMIGYQLQARNYKVRLVNASNNGKTLRQAVLGARSLIKAYHPKVVLLCLGLEDVKAGESLVAMYSNLSEVVRLYQEAGAKVVLFGFKLPEKLPDAYKNKKYRKKFYEIYQKVAQNFRIPFYQNLFKGLDDKAFYRSVDTYHLNERGVRYVSEKTYKTIAGLLQ